MEAYERELLGLLELFEQKSNELFQNNQKLLSCFISFFSSKKKSKCKQRCRFLFFSFQTSLTEKFFQERLELGKAEKFELRAYSGIGR